MAVTHDTVAMLVSKRVGAECLAAANETLPGATIGVITIDDQTDTRSVLPEIRAYCAAYSIPLHVAKSRKASERILSGLKPTVALVVGWYWLISRELLAEIPRGAVGIHFSELPKYRGGSPLVWALINREPFVGVSMFSLTDEMDAGPIWGAQRIAVSPTSYVSDVLAAAETAAAALVRDLLPGLLDGSLQPRQQPVEGVSYGTLRTPDDGAIDWTLPADEVAARVRAQAEPYPGAYTWHGREKLTIWRARADETPHYGAPGAVARIASAGVYVVCGDGRPLILEVVERETRGRLDARAAITSSRTRLSLFPPPGILAESPRPRHPEG